MTERWVWNCTYKNEWWFWMAGTICSARSSAPVPSEAKAKAALRQHLQKACHPSYRGRFGSTLTGGAVQKLKKGERWNVDERKK